MFLLLSGRTCNGLAFCDALPEQAEAHLQFLVPVVHGVLATRYGDTLSPINFSSHDYGFGLSKEKMSFVQWFERKSVLMVWESTCYRENEWNSLRKYGRFPYITVFLTSNSRFVSHLNTSQVEQMPCPLK